MTTRIAASPGRARRQWLAPAGLILLSLIPIIAGAARLTQLTGGAVVTGESARVVDSPIPLVIHIVSVTVYSLLGAFQFVPALRGRRSWHRVAGRILIPAGVLAALSGIWMAVFYPHAHGHGDLTMAFRLIFGSAMLACIALGVRAIVQRDFREHSEWMTRAYAIALGAGTQAIILIPCSIVLGSTQNLTGAILMGVAWVINLAVAEYIIRRRVRRTLRSTPPQLHQLRPTGTAQ